MGNVTGMPPSTSYTPEQALDSAKQLAPTDVLVIGYDADGDLLIRSSRMDRKDALWLLKVAERHVFGD